MSFVAMCMVGVIASLLLAIAGVILRPKQVRFSFQDREDHMVLRLERHIAGGDSIRITMSALREAVRLKLGSDYRRLLIDARQLTLEGPASFWFLIGGLGPALLSPTLRIAVVCSKRSRVAYEFKQSGVLDTFPTEAKALLFLRSETPPRVMPLDREWVESLLVARKPKAPPLKRAA